jgi:hypothetical protein
MKKLLIPIVLVVACFSVNAQSKPEKIITLKLTESQVNLIINSLSDRKISECIDTYVSVRMQTMTQLMDPSEVKTIIDTVKPALKLPVTNTKPKN